MNIIFKNFIKIIEKIHKKISETIWLLPYYRNQIRQYYNDQSIIDTDDHDHHQKIIIIVHRTFWHNWFPSILALFVGITWGYYIRYPDWCNQYQLWLVIKFYPPESEIYTAAMVVVWSGVIISTALYGLGQNYLQEFIYLSILDMNEQNRKYFGKFPFLSFNQNEMIELKQYQNRLLSMLASFIYICTIFASTGQYFQLIERNLLNDNNNILVFVWFFGFQLWGLYTSSTMHFTPGILMIVHRFIEIKQKQLKNRMKTVTNNIYSLQDRYCRPNKSIILLRKYYRIRLLFSRFQRKNLQKLNEQTKRLLTILLISYTLLCTYLIYVIFLTSLPNQYLPLYYLLFTTHSSLMLLLTFTAAKVSGNNYQFDQWNRKTFYQLSRLLLWKGKLKLLIEIENHYQDSGFSLTNDYVITWNAYIYIFHNIKWCDQYQFWLVVKFYPPESEIYTAAMVVVWSGVIISISMYGLGQNYLQKFIYLSILDMNEQNRKYFGFNQNEMIKLKQYQNRLLSMLATFIYICTIFASTGQYFQLIERNLLNDNNNILVFVWFFGFQLWGLYTSSTMHFTPGILMIVHRFIDIKQKQLQNRMKTVTNNIYSLQDCRTNKSIILLRKYYRIRLLFSRFQRKNLQKLDEQTKRLLTILLISYTLLCTYLIYVIFLTSLPNQYLPLYYLLFTTHSSLMLLLTFTAAKVSGNNYQFDQWNRKTFYQLSRLLLWKEKLKLLIEIENHYQDSGFSLTNDYVITWNAYIYIFHNIKIYTAALVVVWSGLFISTALYGFGQNLSDFIYLTILDMNEQNRKYFGKKLKQFQCRLLATLTSFIYTSLIFGSIGQYFQILDQKLLNDNNIIIVIGWFFGFQLWAMYISSSIHFTPGILMIVHRFVEIRQNQLKILMNIIDLNIRSLRRRQTLRRKKSIIKSNYYQIRLLFSRFQRKNLQKLDEQTKRLLTILLISYTLLCTYLIYVIFLTSLPNEYLPLYYLLFITHLSLMLLLTFTASKVSSNNYQFNRWNRKTFYRLSRLLLWNEKLKLLIEIENHYQDSGFSLTNDYVITWNTYIYLQNSNL
ncbi:hypothetical protein DERP_011251 [Dermatophagoides pteronyssinus]|uniref:Uncharacterized protein n=1 Tax=Dermatophagoides pteronyssinus TaxID=6956 RepID=A0ABQ8JCL0_DERPT|nr:hypothetical protein DERP_011251 [Dermatophagoides pteronyssinus]